MSPGKAALLALCLGAGPALAHDGTVHKAAEPAHGPASATPALPFPVALGGSFTLTDQTGAPRGARDPQGRFQLLFFGYANCQSICSVALPSMAEAADHLAARGIDAVPVMVTVDPTRDTVATIGAPLQALHPGFVGLTGTEAALQAVYDLFSVERAVVFEDPDHGPVFAHGSFIYVLGAGGEVKTLLPPVLSPDRIADIVAGYAGSG